MINLQTFPHLNINYSSEEKGIYDKKIQISKGFIATSSSTLFIAKKNIVSLSKSTNTIVKEKGFLLEILFHGFNYSNKRIKHYRPRYFSDTHRSEIFICNELATNTYKSRVYKRRLIFFSYDRHLLNIIEKTIKKFRIPNSYTGKGIFSRYDDYEKKKVKKRR